MSMLNMQLLCTFYDRDILCTMLGGLATLNF